jgi:hypothetical protein
MLLQGLEPRSRHGKETWDEFVRGHGQTRWACDFFTKFTWTMKSPVEVYVLSATC